MLLLQVVLLTVKYQAELHLLVAWWQRFVANVVVVVVLVDADFVDLVVIAYRVLVVAVVVAKDLDEIDSFVAAVELDAAPFPSFALSVYYLSHRYRLVLMSVAIQLLDDQQTHHQRLVASQQMVVPLLSLKLEDVTVVSVVLSASSLL